MHAWRIRNHYGHGAANVPIEWGVHRRPADYDGLIRGLQTALNESEDPRMAWMRLLAFAPLAIFTLFVAASLVNRLASTPIDRSTVQMVMLDSIEFIPPEPEIIASPAPPKPPPVVVAEKPKPTPAPVVKPKAPPKPVKVELAKQPEKPKPRVKPEIVPPKLAVVEPPKPPPTRRRARPEALKREAVRPDLQIDLLAQKQPVPQPSRVERTRKQTPRVERRPDIDLRPVASLEQATPVEVASQTRQRVVVERNDQRQRPALKPLDQAPAIRDESPARQTERFAVAAPSRNPRNRVREAPLLPASSPAVAAPATPEPSRTRRSVASHNTRTPTTHAPTFDSEIASTPAHDPASKPAQRSVRAAAPSADSNTPRVDVRSLSMNTNAASASDHFPAAVSHEDSVRIARVGQKSVVDESPDGPTLQGVPLGSLSACRTDREEDSLKLALVAAAKAQTECTSSAGTYRFVETKNLNAFLMWINRAPGRHVADRCVELKHALECLAH